MGRIIEVNVTDLPQNEHRQLIYKLEKTKHYIDKAIIGYRMIEKNVDVENGKYLLINGLTVASSFNNDALLMIKGPSFIDWM